MRRIVGILCLLVLLAGCSETDLALERAMQMRSKLLTANGCSFDTVITADYGSKIFSFTMHCTSDNQGNVSFTVAEPESISGITGTVSAMGGKLTFDDQVLSFALMADGLVTPISGPWILMKTLRSGYLTSCGLEGNQLRLAVDDSYADDALHLDIWLGEKDLPVRGEVLWQGRRLLSMDVKNFVYL